MTIPKAELDDLKSRVDMRHLVSQDLGSPYGYSKNPIMFQSPFRGGDREPSFAVYADHAFDYGDPGTGAIDHIKYLNLRMGMSFLEAAEHLRKLAGMPELSNIQHRPPEKSRTETRRISENQIEAYSKNLPFVSPYLEQRSIPYTTAHENRLGGDRYTWDYVTSDHRTIPIQRQRVSIPYVAGSQVLSIEFRRDESFVKDYLVAHPGLIDLIRIDLAKKKSTNPESISDDEVITVMFGGRYWRPPNVTPHVFGLNSIVKQREDGKYLTRKIPWGILSEGAMDAAAAQGLGFRTSLGVKSNGNLRLNYLLKDVRLKFIMQDNDEDRLRPNGTTFNPGYENAMRLYNQITNGVFDPTVRIIRIPRPYKDLNDMVCAGVLVDFLAQSQFRIYPNQVEF